jgi:aspartyl/asparaginyl-tRNA synthetase
MVEILKERTTSIHIRRGDYAKLPNHHPMLSMDYNEAIEILKKDTDKFIILVMI